MAVFYDEQLRPALTAALDRQTEQLKTLAAALRLQAAAQASIDRKFDILIDVQMQAVDAQESIASTLEKLYKKFCRPQPPGVLSYAITLENGSMFTFSIGLPDWSLADADVVSGELVVTVAGNGTTIPVTKDMLKVEGLTGNQDDSVLAVLYYIDDAGNKSAPSPALSFVLSDTIPPAAPGELTFSIDSES